jgi:hypothetical protein
VNAAIASAALLPTQIKLDNIGEGWEVGTEVFPNGLFQIELPNPNPNNLINGTVSITATNIKDDGELVGGIVKFTLNDPVTWIPDSGTVCQGQCTVLATIASFTNVGNIWSGSFSIPGTGRDQPAASNITIDFTLVPIPAALPLLATGLVGLWGIGRLRRQQTDAPATA